MREAKSLLDLCIKFCATNIQYIDSIDGFPDEFGGRILCEAMRQGTLDNDQIVAHTALRLYGEAGYWNNVKVPNLLLINEFEGCVESVIENCVKLDLTNVKIDDSHEILVQITNCSLLNILILQDTAISDIGMKKILYPCFGGKKLPFLEYLDLSGLNLSTKLMNNIRHVTQLKQVLFFSDQCEKKILEFRLTQRPSTQKVENSPLLTKLFVHWMKKVAEIRCNKPKQNSSTFYHQPKVPSSKDSICVKVERNKVMFERIHKPLNLSSILTESNRINIKKRGRDPHFQPMMTFKRARLHTDVMEDKMMEHDVMKSDNSDIQNSFSNANNDHCILNLYR